MQWVVVLATLLALIGFPVWNELRARQAAEVAANIETSVDGLTESTESMLAIVEGDLTLMAQQMAEFADGLDLAVQAIDDPNAARVAIVESQMAALNTRLDEFEAVLGSDPARALEVLTLRSELDTLEVRLVAQNETLRSEVRTLSNVFYGLVAVIFIGLLSTWRRPRQSKGL
jgi:hypothetical protein